MTRISNEWYTALRSVDVPEPLARAAATSAIGRDPILAALDLYIGLIASRTPPPMEKARAAAIEVGRFRMSDSPLHLDLGA